MVLFNLPGGLPVYAFSFLLALGALAGLVWTVWHTRARQKPRTAVRTAAQDVANALAAGVWALSGALAGARSAYVFVNWPYFRAHPYETILLPLGGLAWPGALIGGLLALAVYALFNRRKLGRLADALTPLLSALTLTIFTGCWLDGCAYGPLAPWGLPARDEWGQLAPRFPLQLLSAAVALLVFWLLERLAQRRDFRPGAHAALMIFAFSLLMFSVSLLRDDPVPLYLGLGLDGWAALTFALLSLLTFPFLLGRSRTNLR